MKDFDLLKVAGEEAPGFVDDISRLIRERDEARDIARSAFQHVPWQWARAAGSSPSLKWLWKDDWSPDDE